MRHIVTSLLALLAVAAPADAAITGTTPQQQHWLQASLLRLPAADATIVRTGCPGRLEPACLSHESTGWTLYLAEDLGANEQSALLHELAHLADHTMLNQGARDAFRLEIGDLRAWTQEPNSPKEKFAEAFQVCSRHRAIRTTFRWAAYEYRPGPVRHRRVCRLIRYSLSGFFGPPRDFLPAG
jgi:hypothetical protein